MPYFNPRSPHGERHRSLLLIRTSTYFNPRSPHGERPANSGYMAAKQAISIHAPRMGSDLPKIWLVPVILIFQSTLPAWGATVDCLTLSNTKLFQSPLPAWGATIRRSELTRNHRRFQSTLPAWGATYRPLSISVSCRNFNPRSPHGERLRK